MEDLIPLTAVAMPFLMVIAIVVIPAYLKSRERKEMQATIRSAIDKGQALPQELIDAITKDVRRPATALRDLRSGVIWLAVGLGLAGLGTMIGFEERDALHPLLGIAMIPGMIGLALIVLSFFNPNKEPRV
uniref:DUF6249 domain-containing protein n=1 Tax=uncultured Caulobacter sp. TaxID=158749 RepID=UPI0025DEF9C8|nr:DUF6249 domain-containing protein [uncultured Caulobacter sp.]